MCFRPPTIESDQENVCPKCGADLFVGAAKCPACGSEVAAAHTSAVLFPARPKHRKRPSAPIRPPAHKAPSGRRTAAARL